MDSLLVQYPYLEELLKGILGLVQYPYLEELLKGILGLSYTHVIMWLIGGLLIFLAVKYDYEPALLLPIGFGAILANIPHSSAVSTELLSASVLSWLTFRILLQYPLNRVLKVS